MLRRSSMLMVGITAFVVSLASGFITPQARAETPIPITIGYQATPDWLLFTAKELKLFEKVGLAPTYVKFEAGAPMIAAAQVNSIDVADLGTVPFLVGLSQGLDWAMIGIGVEGAYAEGLVARKSSNIHSLIDLHGKRVAYYGGSTAHYGLMIALRQHGITLDQGELRHMLPAEQLAAMQKGEIDAAMVWEPWMQRMAHEANARIVMSEGDLGIYTNVDGYAVRRGWLREHREAAVRFLHALMMARDALQQDRAVGIRVLAQEMGIKEAWAEEIYHDAPPPNMYSWADPRYRYSLVTNAEFSRRLGFLAEFLFDEKVISQEVDVSRALDASVISEALVPAKQGQ